MTAAPDVTAEQVADYARTVMGVELLPWQVDVVRARLAGQVVTLPRRSGRFIMSRAVRGALERAAQ